MKKILTITKSVVFQYNMEGIDKSNARYCKVRFLQVLTIADWGQEPGRPKDLFQTNTNTIQRYNYWDYIIAWRRVFSFKTKHLLFRIFYISLKILHIPYQFGFTNGGTHLDLTKRLYLNQLYKLITIL